MAEKKKPMKKASMIDYFKAPPSAFKHEWLNGPLLDSNTISYSDMDTEAMTLLYNGQFVPAPKFQTSHDLDGTHSDFVVHANSFWATLIKEDFDNPSIPNFAKMLEADKFQITTNGKHLVKGEYEGYLGLLQKPSLSDPYPKYEDIVDITGTDQATAAWFSHFTDVVSEIVAYSGVVWHATLTGDYATMVLVAANLVAKKKADEAEKKPKQIGVTHMGDTRQIALDTALSGFTVKLGRRRVSTAGLAVKVYKSGPIWAVTLDAMTLPPEHGRADVREYWAGAGSNISEAAAKKHAEEKILEVLSVIPGNEQEILSKRRSFPSEAGTSYICLIRALTQLKI